MRPLRLALFLVLAATIAACGDDDDGAGSAIDAAPPDSAVACCPIETPTCNCFGIGGTRDLNQSDPGLQCAAICDAEPDGWVEDTDENGCPILRWVGGTGSCLPLPPDAGT